MELKESEILLQTPPEQAEVIKLSETVPQKGNGFGERLKFYFYT